MKNRKIWILTAVLIVGAGMFLKWSQAISKKMVSAYNDRQSVRISDRDDRIVALRPNRLGYYAEYLNQIPEEFKQLLLKKEDKYFYYHPGINPVSTIRAAVNYLTKQNHIASSTITQQLIKMLLTNEADRSVKNKLKESVYALGLEAQLTKEEILKMYLNAVFFGNNTQGLSAGSRLYFNVSPDALTETQIVRMLATINNPTNNNPFQLSNIQKSKNVAKGLEVILDESQLNEFGLDEIRRKKQVFFDYYTSQTWFEIESLKTAFSGSSKLTIDQDLSERLRDSLRGNLKKLIQKNTLNGAIVVIKLPENEILSIIGSPDPSVDAYGYKINMAVRDRPIGSTIKPFIYLKGFEKNLRPYTLVDDREYKYVIGTGFAFYPKNYDYEYRGIVSLHYALSNSLNVPAVKTLEYIGLDNFYRFLLKDLEFKPVQPLTNYQLGIALGELEMNLTNLAYYFTIFPNNGELRPLQLCLEGSQCTYQAGFNAEQHKQIAEPKYIQLINKILADRQTGVEQFGAKSDLNLMTANYAVKTGTSREFHDSWTMGYTPDFLVGVWLGNSDDTPMDKVSGQTGAGRIWHEAMNLMLNSKYNHNTPFKFELVEEFQNTDGLSYGLKQDSFTAYQNLLMGKEIILEPHEGDIFLLEKDTAIPLKARVAVEWLINGTSVGRGEQVFYAPEAIGRQLVEAVGSDGEKSAVEIVIEKE